MGIYGPRTVFCLAVAGYPSTHEFLLMDDGKWVHVKETTEIGEGKLFAPGNLRATFDNPAYERLISHYLGEKYTLRCGHNNVFWGLDLRKCCLPPGAVTAGCRLPAS